MDKIFTTRLGTLIRIYERAGKKYIRLSELSQGLGYKQYNVDGTLAQIIAGQGLKLERSGRYYELELPAARQVVETFIQNRNQRRDWNQANLGKEILMKLKNEQIGISLFDDNKSASGREPEPVAETTETPDDMSEIVGWAKAIAAHFGVSQAEALRLAEKGMMK